MRRGGESHETVRKLDTVTLPGRRGGGEEVREERCWLVLGCSVDRVGVPSSVLIKRGRVYRCLTSPPLSLGGRGHSWKLLGGILSSSSSAQQFGVSDGRLRGAQAHRGRPCFCLLLTRSSFTSGCADMGSRPVPDVTLQVRFTGPL